MVLHILASNLANRPQQPCPLASSVTSSSSSPASSSKSSVVNSPSRASFLVLTHLLIPSLLNSFFMLFSYISQQSSTVHPFADTKTHISLITSIAHTIYTFYISIHLAQGCIRSHDCFKHNSLAARRTQNTYLYIFPQQLAYSCILPNNKGTSLTFSPFFDKVSHICCLQPHQSSSTTMPVIIVRVLIIFFVNFILQVIIINSPSSCFIPCLH